MAPGFTLINNGYLALGLNIAINAPGAVQVINFGFGQNNTFAGGTFGYRF